MSERGRIVKGEIASFRVRVRLMDIESRKVLEYKWLTVNGSMGVEKAKRMAETMAQDFWPCGNFKIWESDIAQGKVKEAQ